jgi:hypothetical protein
MPLMLPLLLLLLLQGVGSLYWGFVPFLIESFPYDCTELGTYSQLHDWRKAVLKKGDASSSLVASVPDQVSTCGRSVWEGFEV